MHEESDDLAALLYETIKLAGWDLQDSDERYDFVNFLRSGRMREELGKTARDKRIVTIISSIGFVLGTIITLKMPDILAWIGTHFP